MRKRIMSVVVGGMARGRSGFFGVTARIFWVPALFFQSRRKFTLIARELACRFPAPAPHHTPVFSGSPLGERNLSVGCLA